MPDSRQNREDTRMSEKWASGEGYWAHVNLEEIPDLKVTPPGPACCR